MMTVRIALTLSILIALNYASGFLLSISTSRSIRISPFFPAISTHMPDGRSAVNSMTENGNQRQENGLQEHISVLRGQLLESERSWLPYRSRGLREELRQAEEKKVSIFLLNEDDGTSDELFISRTMFEEFIVRNKYVYLIESDEPRTQTTDGLFRRYNSI
jgi:hypothetical protein